ncbi:unnamed protein product [Euphydryas editha]|uniref:Uncharacterized protein n=1 Tax=Euphydryas editha TaxID=104508 RepID=A0AAU9TTT5_EUPED|nr:unnamed protein product [Euphydryas editha]
MCVGFRALDRIIVRKEALANTPVIRALVRDVALDDANINREVLLILSRQKESELLSANQWRQDERVNEHRALQAVFYQLTFLSAHHGANDAARLR